MTTAHKHADVLRAIADGEPLSEFEVTSNGRSWLNVKEAKMTDWFFSDPQQWQVRRKPRTHVVNGFTVPAPIDKELSDNDDYFTPYFQNVSFAQKFRWFDDCEDRNLFKRGLCFATKEAAIANAKAMLNIDPT